MAKAETEINFKTQIIDAAKNHKAKAIAVGLCLSIAGAGVGTVIVGMGGEGSVRAILGGATGALVSPIPPSDTIPKIKEWLNGNSNKPKK